MPGKNWKRVAPTTLSNAIELCIEFAKEKHNRSVDRIAELIGLANKYTLYKWIESGKLPAISIRPFEHACGCDFVTRYLAHSAHKLLIDIPVGRASGEEDLLRLSASCNAAVGVLIEFYQGKGDACRTIETLLLAMERLAWHRMNVQKSQQPELGLDRP
jgi:hypothetical protein